MKWLNVQFVNKLANEMVKCFLCKQTCIWNGYNVLFVNKLVYEMVKCSRCKQTCIWNG